MALLSPGAIEAIGAEHLWLPTGEIVLASDTAVAYVYFPTTAIIGVVGHISSGRMIEVGLYGREGLAGASALFGGSMSPLDRTVQIPGEGFRARLDLVQKEFDKAAAFQKGVLRFAQEFTHQVSMTVICCQFHTVEQRLVRWLLMRHERLDFKTE